MFRTQTFLLIYLRINRRRTLENKKRDGERNEKKIITQTFLRYRCFTFFSQGKHEKCF